MPRSTKATLLIVKALLKVGTHYGLSLSKETGVGAGTLYPILSRLEDDYKWVTSDWEESPFSGRPQRRVYTVTESGLAEGTEFLAKHGHKIEGIEVPAPKPPKKAKPIGSLTARLRSGTGRPLST